MRQPAATPPKLATTVTGSRQGAKDKGLVRFPTALEESRAAVNTGNASASMPSASAWLVVQLVESSELMSSPASASLPSASAWLVPQLVESSKLESSP
eukprot:CAMPEP_0197684300 /NCGR_PEP_ID=MMETSP1338-20131121/99302_1 /TAXON_ID=43686 ORGANISM="Pelagodinium beii, Strain RCC1491" /NCGR_SAMPLE_ID=MMETSP1338 /ASSEMBLY_ACC=CAM_ASM_000754 /LENGTH=97 /DNA_ID=CAMNT_0043265997 /DNA_START=105 /DNA_END=398 /DNA_ORIENTATION=-